MGRYLEDPNLFHLNRRSISRAFAVGLFMACMPIPLQMVAALFAAFICRANIPIAVSTVWITNPITMPPIFYAAYLVGVWVMQLPPEPFAFELSREWLMHQAGTKWKPFLLGCLILGTISATLGFLTVRISWRIILIRKWKLRHF